MIITEKENRRKEKDRGVLSVGRLAINWLVKYEKELWLTIVIVSVGLLGFSLGRLAYFESIRPPVSIQPAPADFSLGVGGEIGGAVVGSRQGTKYHLPWCSGAQRIKEENKIWFESQAAAEAAGYTPAANCPGL